MFSAASVMETVRDHAPGSVRKKMPRIPEKSRYSLFYTGKKVVILDFIPEKKSLFLFLDFCEEKKKVF
jgi:hypothetical protein